jgi:hypothetical protein
MTRQKIETRNLKCAMWLGAQLSNKPWISDYLFPRAGGPDSLVRNCLKRTEFSRPRGRSGAIDEPDDAWFGGKNRQGENMSENLLSPEQIRQSFAQAIKKKEIDLGATREELEHLVGYWMERRLQVDFYGFCAASLSGSDWQCTMYADSRLDRIEKILGAEAMRSLEKAAKAEFQSGMSEEVWRLFTTGTSEEQDAWRDAAWRDALGDGQVK